MGNNGTKSLAADVCHGPAFWACRAALMMVLVLGCAMPAYAQDLRHYAISSQPLGAALNQLALQADRQILVPPDLVRGRTAPALDGSYSLDEALQHVLVGSGLTYEMTGSTVVIKRAAIAPKPARKQSRQQATLEHAPPRTLETVAVTGSRIRGAPPTTPVIDISQQQMAEAGQTNLGEVIRSIPENFSGGQNPGVGLNGGSISDQNLTGGSALNLRGLGPDATLTLLNGHRLSYDGFFQAVDISQIPLAAVDRIEIVADGASAIYGSDAVAGVANVILKPDYNGLSATARLGEATSGGDFQQQYSIVGGSRWSSGGFMAALDSETDTRITGQDRNYTSYMPVPNDIIPSNNALSAIFSGHQDLSSSVTFKVDALYTRRTSDQSANELSAIYETHRTTDQFSLSPELTFQLPDAWTASINGVYGRDRGVIDEPIYALDGALVDEAKDCYCNTTTGAEANAEGPLFELPGGRARAAFGTGYRKNSFNNYSLIDSSEPPTGGSEHSFYAYGQIYLPFVSPGLQVPMVHELSLSGAVRYEKYGEFGDVTTPKVGIIYAPTEDFDFKASWGKSFKIPDLLQEYESQITYLWPAAAVGGIGYPASATALMTYGGNPGLRPEKATSWTATLGLHPRVLPGLQLDITYFRVKYQDRITQAIVNTSVALSDPAYQEFVTLDPTAQQKSDVINSGTGGFYNFTGSPYDPNDVIAILNDLYVNLVSQKIHGVDVNANYEFDWGSDSLTLSENASWLVSSQRNSPLAPVTSLAGTIFNPPHWRSRFGATWKHGNALTLSAFYNFIGGVTDVTSAPVAYGAPMKTVDFTAIWGISKDVDLSASVQNLFNQRPPFWNTPYPFVVNFDSTNYSPIGRFVSVAITKRW